MDYFRSLLKAFLVISGLILLSACSGESDSDEPQIAPIELSSEPLRILGEPDTELYYDSYFSFSVGATGGSGIYALNYIKNPSIIGEEIEEPESANPIEMYIENITSPLESDAPVLPRFRVEAVFDAPADLNVEENPNSKYVFGLELTDGINLTNDVYELSLSLNNVEITTKGDVVEGESSIGSYSNLLTEYNKGNPNVCDQVNNFSLESRKVDGVMVYPAVFVVQLDAPVSKRTTLTYKTNSRYFDHLPERHSNNVNLARPGVDYLPVEDGQIVFEAGQLACFAVVDIVDDSAIEANETFELEVTSFEGAVVDISNAVKSIEIQDYDPDVEIDSISTILNEGDSITIPVTLSGISLNNTQFNVFVDTNSTTASTDDFLLTPNNGQVIIPAGSNKSGISIEILEGIEFDEASSEDEIIVIRTDVDEVLDFEESQITINSWVDSPAVASQASGQKAVDFAIDSRGRIITLQSLTYGDNERVALDVRDRSGKSVSVEGLSDFTLAKENVNVTPISISYDLGYLVIVSEVDGAMVGAPFGQSDFIVTVLVESDSANSYKLNSTSQYGTESADEVTSVRQFGSDLYIGGNSDGLRLNGEAADIANLGGVDGFIYKIDLGANLADWSRFIGTAGDDSLVDIDVGSRDIISSISLPGQTQSGLINAMSTQTKLFRDSIDPVVINSIYDDYIRQISYDSNYSGFLVLTDGLGSLGGGATSSLTHDVIIYSYDAEFNNTSSISLSSPGTDIGVSLEAMEKDNILVVGGYTDGAFSGQEHYGKEDAFISLLSDQGGSAYAEETTIQFGTAEDDRVIAIKQFSDEKVMVLWSEKQSEPGMKTFRVSAISLDGRLLSSLP